MKRRQEREGLGKTTARDALGLLEPLDREVQGQAPHASQVPTAWNSGLNFFFLKVLLKYWKENQVNHLNYLEELCHFGNSKDITNIRGTAARGGPSFSRCLSPPPLGGAAVVPAPLSVRFPCSAAPPTSWTPIWPSCAPQYISGVPTQSQALHWSWEQDGKGRNKFKTHHGTYQV